MQKSRLSKLIFFLSFKELRICKDQRFLKNYVCLKSVEQALLNFLWIKFFFINTNSGFKILATTTVQNLRFFWIEKVGPSSWRSEGRSAWPTQSRTSFATRIHFLTDLRIEGFSTEQGFVLLLIWLACKTISTLDAA